MLLISTISEIPVWYVRWDKQGYPIGLFYRTYGITWDSHPTILVQMVG